ncbi:MAG: FKBP-type peptidyl-prolyl cis-trans isomerase [Bacillus sp. (in: Bacteria)]|nr:FKBP-type peptidyl-prolyl cis-trans isomerase [Bacillus sp. (in: firmicutes)]MCM1427592.1 FKBP-type peptidyl-prolyl cis-trans isomerase [Eubacterium sp.]
MEKRKTNKENENANMSKSKAKREERRREIEAEKRRKRLARTCGIVAIAVIVLIIAAAVSRPIYLAAIRTTSSFDANAGLTADGKISGVDVSSLVTLADYKNISVPADEVAATEEEVDNAINATLNSHRELRTDADLAIVDGDTVNIDYVGTVDGVEFEGGNSGGAGYEVTIGSGSMVDNFEEQLIGHKPGEEVTVNVTFPENYNDELGGKEASFAVTVNGIMVTPELTDEFVAENLAEESGVSTAAEYRGKVESDYYEEHLGEYLTNYIVENAAVSSYPKDYLNAVKSYLKYDDEYTMDYYNQMYASFGMEGYTNVWETRGEEITDELSYERELKMRAQETVKSALVYQAIFEKEGLNLDVDGSASAYLAQEAIAEAVREYLVGLYK